MIGDTNHSGSHNLNPLTVLHPVINIARPIMADAWAIIFVVLSIIFFTRAGLTQHFQPVDTFTVPVHRTPLGWNPIGRVISYFPF